MTIGLPRSTGDARRTIVRVMWFVISLPITMLEYVGRAGVYSAWYLVFYILCMFRPFTGLMVTGAVMILPMTLVTLEHPNAANGMPFWIFPLLSIGLTAVAFGYTMFVDWFAPPGTIDPFERYRKHIRP